ncbi:MAG: epoxyqueuosine reductase QueH [Deltaproteobacteria bacterium]|nr:epoxyqueuosine reductase QueH [Deltaproteobacteria bacterium]
MKLLLHICCGPCSVYPLDRLRRADREVTGYFFNPNIHPYREWKKRLATLVDYADSIDLPLKVREDDQLKEFLREVVFREEDRCRYCYRMRLASAAEEARAGNFDGFSTTLLYSIYQKHDLIRQIAEEAGEKAGVPFIYEDFRPGWKEGADRSRKLGMYRQPYCGCIYSEMERYRLRPGK